MSKFFKRTLTLILSCFALVAFCGFFNTVKVSANEAATPESVIAQINALPEIDEFRVSNASHLSAAQAAGEAYLSLSDEDKALVTNAAALLQYQKVVENSAGQYTWFHGSMDPQAYVNGAGETGGITLDESGNPTIRAFSGASGANVPGNLQFGLYGHAYHLPGEYYGDLEISFDFVSTKEGSNSRFFYVLAYTSVKSGHLYGVGSNVRAFDNKEGAFVCPLVSNNMQDKNFSTVAGSTTTALTAGVAYNYKMTIVGTTITVVVTGKEDGVVYKQSTLDYLAHFGINAPAKREGGIAIGVNQFKLAVSNIQVRQLTNSKVEYATSTINELPAANALTLKNKHQVEAAREVLETLTEEEQAQVENVAVLTAAEQAIAAIEANLPEGWTYNRHTAPYTSITKNEAGNTVINGKSGSNPGQSEFYGSIFTSNIKVSGDFVAEFKFKATAWRDTGRLIGITYYGSEDENGDPTAYAFTVRVRGESAVTAYDRAHAANNPVFYDSNSKTGASIENKEVTMRIIVRDAKLTAYLFYEGNETELRADGFDISTIRKNKGLSTEGTLGVIYSSLTAEIMGFSAMSYDEYVAKNATELINAIPAYETLTTDDTAVVEAARGAYNALSDAAKELVLNYDVLVKAEEKIAQLASSSLTTEEQIAVNAFVALMHFVSPEVTVADKDAIIEARTAYNALTDNAKAAVATQYSTLTLAEVAYYEALVATLPAVNALTLADAEAVAEVRAVYNALSADQQAGTSVETLKALESRLVYLEDIANLPEGWTFNQHSTPFTDITKNEAGNTVIKGKSDANPGITQYFGSLFNTGLSVEGNFVAEFTFKVDWTRDTSRLVGITYYGAEDENGYPSAYAFTVRVNGQSALTAYDRAEGATAPTFNDNTILGNQMGIFELEVTMKIVVHDGLVSGFLYYEGNLIELRASEVALAGMMKNTTEVRSAGSLGIIVSSLQVEVKEFKTSSYDAYVAQAVKEQIAALPTVEEITLGDAEAVAKAREAYEALSVEGKAAVDNYEVLTALEAKLVELENADVNAVIALIEALDTNVVLTEEYKATLDAAKAAYDALTAEQQAKVTNYSALTALIEEYNAKKAEVEASEARVANVIALIDELPAASVIMLEDEAVINAAQSAYESLSAEEQAKITNVEKLNAAIAKLAELKNPVTPDSSSIGSSEVVDSSSDSSLKSCQSSMVGLDLAFVMAIAGVIILKKRNNK